MTARATLAGLLRAGAGRLLDPNPVPREWDHVTKVDPEPEKRLPLLYPLHLAGTDALSVGGSSGVTAADVEATFDLLGALETPALQEPSGPEQVTPGTLAAADLLAVPEVLNGDSRALVGDLGAAIERVREEFAPDLLAEAAPWLPGVVRGRLTDLATDLLFDAAAFEAYIVQNPDSAAARTAGVDPEDVLSATEARRRAAAAERHLRSEIVYLEYSGTFGGGEATETLRELATVCDRARLWYGGGLADADDVAAVREAGAETVVVGDAFHRVAEAEATLLADAAAGDPPDDRRALRSWVDDRYDPATAAAYLSTQPRVEAPERRATRIATHTVALWRLASSLAEAVRPAGGPSPAAAVADVPADALTGLAALSVALDDGAEAFLRERLRGLVADLAGLAPPAELVHLGVPERVEA